jgi:hypothetical protein
MVTLKFTVDKDFILQHVLRSYSDHLPFLRLKKMVWVKNKNLYQILSQNLEPLIMERGFIGGCINATADVKKNLLEIYGTDEFKKIFREVGEYADQVKKQWDKNYAASAGFLTDILNVDTTKIRKEITVYVSHPRLWRGRSYIEEDVIAWSHPDEWKNYATVYLWHEVMHHITADMPCAPNLMHALIELSCDNELRIRLNGGGIYFKEGGIPLGHKYLANLDKKLLPDWKKYLKDPDENIYHFEQRMRKKYKREKLLKPMSDIVQWAEWH